MKSRVVRIFLVAFMVMACGGFFGFSQAEAKDVWVYTVPDSEFGAGYEVYVDMKASAVLFSAVMKVMFRALASRYGMASC